MRPSTDLLITNGLRRVVLNVGDTWPFSLEDGRCCENRNWRKIFVGRI
jgi:hypothetical protein